MKRVGKLKTLILSMLICIFCISPALSGCFNLTDLKVQTPEIKLHESSQCISWKAVEFPSSS